MKNILLAVGMLVFLAACAAYPQPMNYPSDEPWRISCSTDSMTDKKSCQILYTRWFTVGTDLHYEVATLGVEPNSLGISQKNLYPHRPVYVRVDKDTLHESSYYQDNVVLFFDKKLIEEMKTGETLLVRYTEWPSALSREFIVPLKDFSGYYELQFGVVNK